MKQTVLDAIKNAIHIRNWFRLVLATTILDIDSGHADQPERIISVAEARLFPDFVIEETLCEAVTRLFRLQVPAFTARAGLCGSAARGNHRVCRCLTRAPNCPDGACK